MDQKTFEAMMERDAREAADIVHSMVMELTQLRLDKRELTQENDKLRIRNIALQATVDAMKRERIEQQTLHGRIHDQ